LTAELLFPKLGYKFIINFYIRLKGDNMKNLIIIAFIIGLVALNGCQSDQSAPSAPVVTSSTGTQQQLSAPSEGTTTPSNVTIIVLPTPPDPPVASTTILWPPNKKMVTVTLTGTLSDPATLSFEDEYGQIQYSDRTLPAGNYSESFSIEASRDGTDKDGRCYTFTLSNDAGSASVTVICPHNK
jgi:hypothetical protein